MRRATEPDPITQEDAMTRTYTLTSSPVTVSIFDGRLESDIDVAGAHVTITTADGADTWTGTVSSPDGAHSMDEWLSGTVSDLALRHGRHIMDELAEAVYQAAKGLSYSATIAID